MEPFALNILDIKRTFLEKIVSLIRFSFEKDYITGISGKVRHFYDLYYLLQNAQCFDYLNSSNFIEDFKDLVNHDKKAFEEPDNWQNKNILESPLFNNFDEISNKLGAKYKDELSKLAYSEIPENDKVFNSTKMIFRRIKNI